MGHVLLRGSQTKIVAACGGSDAVNDLVYVTGPAVGGLVQVSKADIDDVAKMPAIGIITAKSTSTRCTVALGGVVPIAGLLPGATYFVGPTGQPTRTRPPAGPAGRFIQAIGIALDVGRLSLNPSPQMTKVIP